LGPYFAQNFASKFGQGLSGTSSSGTPFLREVARILLLLVLLYSINTEGQPGGPGSLNTELVINTNAGSNTLKLDRMDWMCD